MNEKLRESIGNTYSSFASGSLEDLSHEISFEKLENTQEGENYLKLVMNESLRIEPPIPLSTSFCMTEDVDIVGIPVKKGEMMIINI